MYAPTIHISTPFRKILVSILPFYLLVGFTRNMIQTHTKMSRTRLTKGHDLLYFIAKVDRSSKKIIGGKATLLAQPIDVFGLEEVGAPLLIGADDVYPLQSDKINTTTYEYVAVMYSPLSYFHGGVTASIPALYQQGDTVVSITYSYPLVYRSMAFVSEKAVEDGFRKYLKRLARNHRIQLGKVRTIDDGPKLSDILDEAMVEANPKLSDILGELDVEPQVSQVPTGNAMLAWVYSQGAKGNLGKLQEFVDKRNHQISTIKDLEAKMLQEANEALRNSFSMVLTALKGDVVMLEKDINNLLEQRHEV